MQYSCRHRQRIESNFPQATVAIQGWMDPNQPWMDTVAGGKFYEVDSLAVATRISHNYQVLLDDGNRIIIPHGNFKFYIY